MKSADIRARFLAFFKNRAHAVIPSASLVTSDEKGVTNPTLFNTAGMQPLIPYLLGKTHSAGTRLVDVQKCVRTVDIDEIGDNTHATFFEMLGNWSLGDYFKKEAIQWSYDFLTSKEEGLGLDPARLYVTVFSGDANAPRDEEAAAIWTDVFASHDISGNRIFYLGADKNWWQAGETGPCGPDTEMYYDVANTFGGKGLSHEEFVAADAANHVVEVWNDVFMQYEKVDGKIFGNLPKRCVDTGAGLERLAMNLQGKNNIFETDLLAALMNVTKTMSGDIRDQRIIADHLRASVFLIGDGVTPSNTGRGYVLRRLIRKALFHSRDTAWNKELVHKVVLATQSIYDGLYKEILATDHIVSVLFDEVQKFSAVIAQGRREFDKIAKGAISGADAFMLFASHGLPIDMTVALAKERGLSVDTAGFDTEFKKHQDLSRVGAEKKFKGGLEDANDPQVVRYHTATHLLHQALHDVLGEAVMQKGSNITAERLRFDFVHGAKMTDEEKKRVETIVNEKIAAKLPVTKVVMPKSEAEKTGARHFFGEKYGDEVSIYFIGADLASAYSKEFCGGPHVTNTFDLAGPEGKWKFKIQKEEAISQGVRRIKAVLV